MGVGNLRKVSRLFDTAAGREVTEVDLRGIIIVKVGLVIGE